MIPFRLAANTYLLLYPGLAIDVDAVVGLVMLGGEAVIIDSGSGLPPSIALIYQSLATLNLRPSRIRVVVNTHCHLPNSGGDYWFHGQGALIAARWPDSRGIETGDPALTASEDYGARLKPTPVGITIRPGEDYVIVEDPVKVTAMHTPGHTPGSQSVVVEDSDKTLIFVGDALGRLKKAWGSDPKDWARSLERIRGVEADILCTSVSCYEGRAARSIVEEAMNRGPEWIDG